MQGTAQHNVKIHHTDSLTDGPGPVLKQLVGFSPDTCSHKTNYSVPSLQMGGDPREGLFWEGKLLSRVWSLGCCIAKDGHCRGCWDAETFG